MARKLHLGSVGREAPKLSLPGKLVFPSMHNTGHFSMLGLGDIVSAWLELSDLVWSYWMFFLESWDQEVLISIGVLSCIATILLG